MRLSIVLFVLGLLTSSGAGCAAMKAAHCNYDGAFTAGLNDARKGKEMSNAPAFICDAKNKPVVRRAYREGYLRGSAATIYVVPR